MKSKEGFTLVELIVVIAIIAVLTAITVPLVSGYVVDAQSASCESQRAALIRQYEADYASASVARNLTQSDAQALAVAASVKLRGSGSYPKITDMCSAGGVYTLRVVGDKLTVTCSEHGTSGLPARVPTLAEETTFKKIIEVLEGYSSIDSTALGAATLLNKMLDYFSENGIDLSEFNIKSWAVASEGHKYDSGEKYPTLYWTDQDISKLNVGDKVKVVRYNDGAKTFTAGYMTIGERNNKGSAYYNVLTNGTWSEYAGQNSETKANYADTVGIFNTMPDTK